MPTTLREWSRLCAAKAVNAWCWTWDNTVWGGIVGDDGLEGIQVAQGDATGEAHLTVQRLALELRDRGVVLAVSSKNNDDVARLPFQEASGNAFA